MPGPLKNTQHENAAIFRFSGMALDSAYRAAGYKGNKTQASKLFARKDVQARIEELQEQFRQTVFDNLGVTKETITAEMNENRQFAIKQKNPGAANTATRDKATLHGLMDQGKANVILNLDIDNMPTDDLLALARRLGISEFG